MARSILEKRLSRLEKRAGSHAVCADKLAVIHRRLLENPDLEQVCVGGLVMTRADLEHARRKAQAFEDWMLNQDGTQ